MKNYIKPEINTQNFSANSPIANGLQGWLTENGMQTYENSITTYYYSES